MHMMRWSLLMLCGCLGVPERFETSGLPIEPIAQDAGAARPATFGRISLRDTVSHGGHLNDLGADFGLRDGCTREPVGNCVITRCDDSAGFEEQDMDIGPLTVSGVTFVGSPVPLSVQQPPYWQSSARPRQLWDGGEPISVTSGSFRLEARAPSPMSLEAPSCTSSSCLATFSRSRPLSVDWSPGSIGTAVVRVSLDRYVTPAFRLKHVGAFECEFPGEAVRGTIPVEVLSRLPALSDAGVDESRIAVLRRSSASALVDAGTVTFDLEWVALSDSCAWD